MTNEGMANDLMTKRRGASFVIRISSLFRASTFVIRHFILLLSTASLDKE